MADYVRHRRLGPRPCRATGNSLPLTGKILPALPLTRSKSAEILLFPFRPKGGNEVWHGICSYSLRAWVMPKPDHLFR
jgi:hypothetical protein